MLLDEQHLPLVSQLCLASMHVPELLLLGDIGLPGALLYIIECTSCCDAGSHHHQYFWLYGDLSHCRRATVTRSPLVQAPGQLPLVAVQLLCIKFDSKFLCLECVGLKAEQQQQQQQHPAALMMALVAAAVVLVVAHRGSSTPSTTCSWLTPFLLDLLELIYALLLWLACHTR